MAIELVQLNDFTNQQVGLDGIWSEIRAMKDNGLDTRDNNGQVAQAPNIEPYNPPKNETTSSTDTSTTPPQVITQ